MKMLSDNDSKADLDILEEDYPLHTLNGMNAMMKQSWLRRIFAIF